MTRKPGVSRQFREQQVSNSMQNPYQGFAPRAFWRKAVGELSPFAIGGLWQPKFPVRPQHRIVTAGSCFAQHIGKALKARGYRWLDAEPAPSLMKPEDAQSFNYGIFSFRTGNIYTTRMLRQWMEQAFGAAPVPGEVWQRDGRFFDPMRPAIEPGGFASRAELNAARRATHAAIRRAVEEADLFVFTLGLTESWANRETGLEYASCPGTAAGTYDEGKHVFVNHRPAAIEADLKAALEIMRAANPALRVLLTVSPVPLTATASGGHVLPATTWSKSALRAVAGMVAEDHDFVDYFPSYEIITAPAFRGMFYAPNQRSVIPEGVDFVMRSFFADQEAAFGKAVKAQRRPADRPAGRGKQPWAARRARKAGASTGAIKCEEELLDAFASG